MAATLEEVALRASVSEGTVSRVLRNDRSNGFRISATTRQRILDVARELNYVPNSAARAMARGRTGLIGVVVPRLNASFFENVLMGIQQAAMQQKCAVVLHFIGHNGFAEDEILAALRSCKIDGCIAAHSALPAVAYQEFRQQNVPLVLLSPYVETEYAAVHVRDEVGGRLVGEHLLQLGHRRIAYIGHDGEAFSDRRRQGVVDALQAGGVQLVAPPPALDLPADQEWWELGESLTQRLLVSRPEVTAIVCSDDYVAMGALEAARKLGRQVPRDLSITGYDSMFWTRFSFPALTSVEQPKEEQGVRAVELLWELLEGGTPREIWLEPQLTVRGSSAPPVQAA